MGLGVYGFRVYRAFRVYGFWVSGLRAFPFIECLGLGA